MHFKHKIEISHNTYQNILIYESSRINCVAMNIYVQCPDLKYCYLKNIDTIYWKPDNLYKAQYLLYSDIIFVVVFSYYNIIIMSWKIFIIMINRQKHYTKYLHDKLETKDIRCI